MSVKVIAECGWNHGGDMKLAKEMISSAWRSGATFAKFQTWSVKRLKPGPWDNDGRREIYEKAELSFDDHMELKEFCEERTIKFMSSVFSIPDAELLKHVENRWVKIPSFECRNWELINYCMDNFKELYISFGTSTFDELLEFSERYENRMEQIIPMHCVSTYPLNPEDANIRRMKLIRDVLGTKSVGYSDHMEGVESAKVAIGLGATTIEKHFTIDKSLPGRDNQFACMPEDISDLTEFIDLREAMMKSIAHDFQKCEKESRDIYTGRFNKKQ